jgi:diaminohydroxyphosphoribosylaminopyrimidine deaminase / 5-amino-6-(5-phosphoribosylamino)uracil reductase
MNWLPTDIHYMQRALQLAAMGLGYVAPNPLVGCVLVHQNHIVGEGYHQYYGQAHAEVNAIASVKDPAILPSTTAYVSLEPCSHFGKTPPCADLLIKHGIKKIFVAQQDPFAEVAGRGIQKLREAGAEVLVGLCEAEAQHLNRRFFTFLESNRPYVILKWAQSADGYLSAAKGQPTAISNPISQKLVHKWRSQEAAILVGTNTAQADNPALNSRHWQGPNPTRVVLDRQLRLSETLNVFDGSSPTLWYNTLIAGQKPGYEMVKLDNADDFLSQVLYDLAARGIQSVLVEGGAQILERLIKLNLWHEARIGIAPIKLQTGLMAPYLPLNNTKVINTLGDLWYTVYNNKI